MAGDSTTSSSWGDVLGGFASKAFDAVIAKDTNSAQVKIAQYQNQPTATTGIGSWGLPSWMTLNGQGAQSSTASLYGSQNAGSGMGAMLPIMLGAAALVLVVVLLKR
jgi:hypothetical protein